MISGFAKRAIWLVALFLCAVGVTYHTTTLVLKYLRFDVKTEVVLHQNQSLPFPAVTVSVNVQGITLL